MYKRFWRSFMALTLGAALLLGTGGAVPALTARAAEGEDKPIAQPIENVQPDEVQQPETAEEKEPAASIAESKPSGAIEENKPEEKKPDEEKKAETRITYIAGGKSASVKATAGSKIPGLSALGLKAPDGKRFVCWGTSESGGTAYKAGGKYGSDVSKLPSKLYAHWETMEEKAEKPAEGETPVTNSVVTPVANNSVTPVEGGTPAVEDNALLVGNDATPVANTVVTPVANNSATPMEGETPAVEDNALLVGNDATPAANTVVTPVANTAITPTEGKTPAENTAITPTEGDTPAANTAITPTEGETPAANTAITPTEGETPMESNQLTPGEGEPSADGSNGAPATERTIVYSLGGASATVTAALGSGLPAPGGVGLTVPEDQLFYWWSSSSDGSSDDAYSPGDEITASTPATLYAMCGPAMSLMAVPIAPAFSRVRYYQTATDTGYIEVTSSIESARAYNSVGFQNKKAGEQFLYWQTAGGAPILPGAPIDALPATGMDGSGIAYLNLYGVWQSASVPPLTMTQTADKPYLGRGETVTYTISVTNTDAVNDAYVRLENIVDSRFTVLQHTSQTVRWDLRVNHGTTAAVTLAVRANDDAGDGMIFNTPTVVKEVKVDPAATASMAAQLDAAPAISSPSASVRTDVLQVAYHGNGGTVNGAASFVDNTGYRNVQANRFTRSAAVFLCWNTAPDGSGTNYAPGAAISIEGVFAATKVLDLYAKWSLPVMDISKTTMNEAVSPGQVVSYTIRVKNTGDVPANNTVIIDTLPANLTYVSANPAAQIVGGQTLQWSVGVPAKGVSTLTVSARVNAGLSTGTVLENRAAITTIGGLTADSVNFPGSASFSASVVSRVSAKRIVYHPQNGEADYVADGDGAPVALDLSAIFARAGYQLIGWNTQANGLGTPYAFGQALPAFTSGEFPLYGVWASSTGLHIAKTADKAAIAPGESVVFTVTVSNTGAAAALNVTIAEQPDANLLSCADYVTNSAAASMGAYDQTTRVWSIPSLAANATATLRLTYKAKVAVPGNAVLVNAAQITGHMAAPGVILKAPDPAIASVSVQLNIGAGSLRVSKTVKGNRANTARDFTFRLTLKDAAGNTLPGAVAATTSSGTACSFPLNQPIAFTLRHGQSILFWNLPAGAQYTVEEVDYSGYWPNHKAFSGVIRGEVSADFVNSRNRNTDIPKTGYGEGSEGLLWLTLPLLAGALWLLLSKKRRASAEQQNG